MDDLLLLRTSYSEGTQYVLEHELIHTVKYAKDAQKRLVGS